MHFLQKEAAAICSGLNIPYVYAPVVKVPDLTGEQRKVVNTVVSGTVKVARSSKVAAPDNSASIRVVRTVPNTLRKVVEKFENTAAWSDTRPECCCTEQYRPVWEAAGTVTELHGHFALLPVTIMHFSEVLRTGDPLPQHGQKSRSDCIDGLERLGSTLHAEYPNWCVTVSYIS